MSGDRFQNLQPTANVYVIRDAGDLPQQLDRFRIYHLLYDPGAGAGLYFSPDAVSLVRLASGGSTLPAGTVDNSIIRWDTGGAVWLEFSLFILPLADGAADQIMQTDGAGVVTWVDIPSSVAAGTVESSTLRWDNVGTEWVENVDVRTLAGLIFRGTTAGDILTLTGSSGSPDKGRVEFDAPIESNYDSISNTTPAEQYAFRWRPTFTANIAYVGGFLNVAPTVTISTAVFIPATFSDGSVMLTAIAPGFSAFTFINELAIIQNSGNFDLMGALIFNIALQHQRNTSGTSSSVGVTGLNFAPSSRTTILGAVLNKTGQTAVVCRPAFSTVAGSTVNLGTIRAVHAQNPTVALFQPQAGVETADGIYGLDVDAMPFGGTAVPKAAVRSGLVAGADQHFLLNLGNALSDFRNSFIKFNNNFGIQWGTSADVIENWDNGQDAIEWNPVFGPGGESLYLRPTGNDTWIFQQADTGVDDIGIGFDVNALSFGPADPVPNSNNWFALYNAPNLRTPNVPGEYSDILYSAAGSLDIDGLAMTEVASLKVNSLGILLNGGTIDDLANVRIEGMASFGATLVHSLQMTGRFTLDGVMSPGSESPAQLTGNQDDWNLAPNNAMRTIVLMDSDGAYNVTGIESSFGFAQDGDQRTIINTSAFVMSFTNEDAASLAANRFQNVDSVTIEVDPQGSVTYRYEGGVSRWQQLYVTKADGLELPVGSVLGHTIRWDVGTAQYVLATGILFNATGNPPGPGTGYIDFSTTATADVTRPQMWWSALNTRSVHYFAEWSATEGFWLETESDTHTWGWYSSLTKRPRFRINAATDQVEYDAQGGGGWFEISTVDSLIQDGTTEGAMLVWDVGNTAWEERPTLTYLLNTDITGAGNFGNELQISNSLQDNMGITFQGPVSNAHIFYNESSDILFINSQNIEITASSTVIPNVCRFGSAGDQLSIETLAGSAMRMLTTTGSGRDLAILADNGSRDLHLTFGTGLLMDEKASQHSQLAGEGQFWVRDDSPNVPIYTDDTGQDFNLLEVQGGSSIIAAYRFQTSIVEADPGSGNLRYDNATPASVTELFISATTDNGVDLQNILSFISNGDRVYFQQDNDSSKYLLFDVTANVDNGGWFSLAGTVSNSGTIPDSNAKCHILILFGASAGGVPDPLIIGRAILTNTNAPDLVDTIVALNVGAADPDVSQHLELGPDSIQSKSSDTGASALNLNPVASHVNAYFGSALKLQTASRGIAILGLAGGDPAVGGTQRTQFAFQNNGGQQLSTCGFGPGATTTLHLHNDVQDGLVELRATNTALSDTMVFLGDPNGQAELFNTGVSVARSLGAAAGGLEANNTLTGAGFERVLTTSDLVAAGITATPTPASGEMALWDSTGATLAGTPLVTFVGSQFTITGFLEVTSTVVFNSLFYIQQMADAGADVPTYGQAWYDSDDDRLKWTPDTGVDNILAYVSELGGQVDSVAGGTNINVTGTAADPIVNLDAAITGVSVNGVTLNAAGAATNFLNETGAYSVPPGGLPTGTVTNSTLRWDGAAWVEEVDVRILSTGAFAIFNGSDQVQFIHDGNDLNVTSVATASMSFVSLDLRMDDNVELQFGTSDDVRIRWTGVFWDFAGAPAHFQDNLLVRDGSIFAIYDGGNNDNVNWIHNGTDLIVAETGTGAIRHSSINMGFGDGDLLMFGNADDAQFDWNNAASEFRLNIAGVASEFEIRLNGGQGFKTVQGGATFLGYSGIYPFQTLEYFATGNTSGAQILAHSGHGLDVGFNELHVINDNVSDTLEASHCGQLAFKDATTARTLTLASNVDLDFPVSGMTTVINAFTSGNYTITEGASTTLYYLDGATRIDTAGGATIGPGGVANIWRESATVYYMWGTGITP